MTRPAGAGPGVWAAAIAAGMSFAAGACSEGPIDIAGSPLLAGMVAHWKLDDGAGTRAIDVSGNHWDGTVTLGTGAWTSSGKFGGALHFQGGTAIAVDNFLQATERWTVALWVRPAAFDFGPQFVTLLSTEIPLSTIVDPHPGGGWQMNMATRATTTGETDYQFAYWLGPDSGDYHIYDCNCATQSVWTHVAAVVDGPGQTLKFYANGFFRGLGIYAPMRAAPIRPILKGNDTLYFGRWQPPTGITELRPFEGDLDDVVIYSRALADEEVIELFQTAAPSRRP